MSAIPDNIGRMRGIADTRVVAVEQSLLGEVLQVGRSLSASQQRTEVLHAVAAFMDCAANQLELMLHRIVLARTGDGLPLTY